jgi:hypothetical protein
LRPYSNFGSLAFWTHNGDSYYNGLQTLFRTQVGQLRLQAAYTWSHAIADIVTDDSSGGTGNQSFTVASNPKLDRGNTSTNRPNIFVANGTYLLPSLRGRNFVTEQALGGWELTGITTANSGNSFTIFQNGISETAGNLVTGSKTTVSSLFQSGLVSNQRPLLAAGTSCNSGPGIKGNQIISPTAFTLIGYHLGTFEPTTAPRGACHGPKLVNTDMSIDKNWKILHERANIQFRFDAFDLFNHANFRPDQGNFTAINSVNCGAPDGAGKYLPCSATNNVVTAQVRNSSFGQSTGLVGNAQRQFQYGLHITF